MARPAVTLLTEDMTTPQTETVVVVGGGVAGGTAAVELREQGFDGPVVLVGAESEPPYERPPLSKEYLAGSKEFDAALVRDPSWYDEHDVELRLGRSVTAVDRDAHEVHLDDGTTLEYRQLLLATGARPRTLPVPGAERALLLRTRADSDRIRSVIGPDRRVVVVGGGWIGLEVAAVARAAGAEVTVVEQASLPLLTVLGPQIAPVFVDLHREHGVQMLVGASVRSIEPGSVDLGDTVLPADVVVAGVGVTPDTSLAEAAGLPVEDGVLVDAALRTSDPDVFAAGDVAAAFHPRYGRHVRVEHWANALNQGPAAARSMLGQDVVYDRLPYFFTDQYDLGMEYTGYVPPEQLDQARVVVRGDLGARTFQAFWLLHTGSGWRAVAAMHANMWDEGIDPLRQVLLAGGVVDPEALQRG
jgi:3-phenylpropionate/trans-cinnamate dioxygenase ferredoxin reductase component